MFTGIIEVIGIVDSCRFFSKRRSLALGIRVPKFSGSLKIGGSLAVNGVCLTVIRKKARRVYFDLVEETLRRSTFAVLRKGDRVNLERPLKPSGRLDGHLVLGHVDTTGAIRRILKKEGSQDFLIMFPGTLRPYIYEKGSVAVNGVSLTIGKVTGNHFWAHCIPHTLKSTNFQILKKGDKVNLEADALIKLAVKELEAKRFLSRTLKRVKVR